MMIRRLLDVDIRTSTVLGVVGAGGIGLLLSESIRTLGLEVVWAIVIVIFVIVFAIERLPGWIRSKQV
ncbi:Phosphate-import permease protein PhnE [Gordonia sp. YY1]|nr:Phosphate-import permease protein PhnE [Gordonia sp. YY1]